MSDAGTGPFVAVAALCQSVERRDDGSMDVIGIIEGVLLEAPPPDERDPLGLNPIATLPLRLVVSLRAGSTRGHAEVRIIGRYPGGNEGPSTGVAVEFSEQRPVATINVPLALEVHEAGDYQFDVLAAGRLLTVVPLRVMVTAGGVV